MILICDTMSFRENFSIGYSIAQNKEEQQKKEEIH